MTKTTNTTPIVDLVLSFIYQIEKKKYTLIESIRMEDHRIQNRMRELNIYVQFLVSENVASFSEAFDLMYNILIEDENIIPETDDEIDLNIGDD